MSNQNFISNVKSVIDLDLRALAILRISLSIVLFADLFIRITDLKAFYTDEGVLPLSVLFQHLWNHSYFSFFTATNNYYLQALIFVIYFSCLFCLLIGYKTRLFTILTWLFLASLQSRNPLIVQGGDHFIRLLVFWAIFLPWGYLYSVDSYKNIALKRSFSFRSAATLAYICQIVFLYVFSALLKTSPEWNTDFTALYYALSLDQMITPLGEWIYPNFQFLKFLTAMVYYIELIVPFLLFIPFYNAWFRMFVIVIIVIMQINIYLTMNVGLFSITSIVAMIGLIPTYFIDLCVNKYNYFIHNLKADVNRFMLRFTNPTVNETIAPPKRRLFTQLFVFCALLYALGWNLNTIGKKVIPDDMVWIGNLLRLHQHWSMFAPAVYKEDGWIILEATTTEGKKLDLMNGETINYKKPARVADLIKNDRWRKYIENIVSINYAHLRPYYCNFLLNEWNDHNSEISYVKELKIIYMLENTLPDYEIAQPEPLLICTCTSAPEQN